jgi:hypothetical protein
MITVCVSSVRQAGLPNKKYQSGYIWEALGMENVGIFYGHKEYLKAILVYLMAILYILWSFGMLYQDKSGNPGVRSSSSWRSMALKM